MATLLGIDLGTSGVKAMLCEDSGRHIATERRAYAVDFLPGGGAEQDARLWWRMTLETLHALCSAHPAAYGAVKAVGLSGQMHGLVCLGKGGEPLRPAIIWMDNRTAKQAGHISEALGEAQIARVLHNRPFPGFALPSLLWVREHEPEVFGSIACVLQPKDYIRYQLTGELGADYSDAAATTAFDIGARQWSFELIERLRLPGGIFPKAAQGTDIAGGVSQSAAELTGLPKGAPVVYGAGDQPAQSVGNGSVAQDAFASNIGTSAQLAAYSPSDAFDPRMRVHTFNHALDNAYTIFGAILCGGAVLKWLKNEVLHAPDYDAMSAMAQSAACGSDGLVFLPYLNGERTPHMDPAAKGVYFGLTLRHTGAHLVRAAMEGVCFALKNACDIFGEMGISAQRVIASGGGAKSEVWLQMQSSILEKDIVVCDVEEQAALGACILAALGTGMYPDARAACGAFVRYGERVYRPIESEAAVYRERYALYNALYEQNKALFARVGNR